MKTFEIHTPEGVKTCEIPESEKELSPALLFRLLAALKDEMTNAEIAAAWLDLSPEILNQYTADILIDIEACTAWFMPFVLSLSTAKPPKFVNIAGNEIDIKSCADNMSIGALEYLRAQENFENWKEILYQCLRLEHSDNNGRYVCILPKAQALKDIEALEAKDAHSLINFFFQKATKLPKPSIYTRLTLRALVWAVSILTNTGQSI